MKARLHDVMFDARGKQMVTFCLDRKQDISSLDGKDIRLKATQWREKRSLEANSYFYVLATKIADATAQSLTEVHNQLIADYGQLEMTEAGVMTIIMEDTIDWRKLEGIHLRPTGKRKTMDNGRLYQVYLVMRGSHTYDTKAMSTLIDGTIREAEELGIETITPEKKRELLERWQIA